MPGSVAWQPGSTIKAPPPLHTFLGLTMGEERLPTGGQRLVKSKSCDCELQIPQPDARPARSQTATKSSQVALGLAQRQSKCTSMLIWC